MSPYLASEHPRKVWRSVPPDPTFARPQSCHLWTWALEWLLWLDGDFGGDCMIGIDRKLKKCCKLTIIGNINRKTQPIQDWDCQPQKSSYLEARLHDRLVETYSGCLDIPQKRGLKAGSDVYWHWQLQLYPTLSID